LTQKSKLNRRSYDMSAIAKKRLSLSEKFSRLAVRLRDPEWRRYGGTLLGGKLLGVGLEGERGEP
jgi:hypothetical protein